MELRQLRYLIAIADEQSFTRAAHASNVAQPALSQQIAKLESELGISLVDRTRRGALLSEAGRIVVARGRVALAEVAAIPEEVGQLTDFQTGSLRVGVTVTPGPLDVARVLASFHRARPHIDIALTEDLSASLVEQLRGDVIDVAFVTAVGERDRAGLDLRPIAREPLVVIVPVDHRLAGRTRIRIDDLREESFVSFKRGATVRQAVEDAAGQAGFRPRVRFEAGEVGRIRALVSEGLAVAVLPRSDGLAPGPDVAVVALAGPRLLHALFLAHRAGRRLPPAVAAFLEHAAEHSG